MEEEQQPETNGIVIIKTNKGDLEIELWSKETEKTCRNFIELCLKNYYDKCEFFRLIKGFMIQTGDPSNTGIGGQSIYGSDFKDEFHQKLKFNYRGLLGMANSGKDSNNSQFFITFDSCNYLDYKHTIFGKVVGETIYNLINIQDAEVDENNRPIEPIFILSTQVIHNPFTDILLYNQTKANQYNKNTNKKIHNQNLLSFQQEEEEQIINSKFKVVSQHDILNDKKLSKNPAVSSKVLSQEQQQKLQTLDLLKKKIKGEDKIEEQKIQEHIIKEKTKQIQEKIKERQNDIVKIDIQNDQDKKLIQEMKRRLNKRTGKVEIYWSSSSDSEKEKQIESSDEDEYKDEQEKKIREQQKKEYDNLKIEYLQFKKDKVGTNNNEVIEKKQNEIKLLSNLEKQRLYYLNKSRQMKHNEDILQKLNQFKAKLYCDQVQNNESHWMNNKLKFHIDSANAYQQFNNKQQVEKTIIDIQKQQTNNNHIKLSDSKHEQSNINVNKLIEMSNK